MISLGLDDKPDATQQDQPLCLTRVTEDNVFARSRTTRKVYNANERCGKVKRLGILRSQVELGEDGGNRANPKGEVPVRLVDKDACIRILVGLMKRRQSQNKMQDRWKVQTPLGNMNLPQRMAMGILGQGTVSRYNEAVEELQVCQR